MYNPSFTDSLYSQDSLYHHGILGQKWGVRRYQNPDGSYTDAGKKRYLNNDTTTLFGRLKQNRAERKELRSRIANAQKRNLNTTGRTDSKEIAKIKDEYKKAMNSDKLRMLRAEAKLADKESIDALNNRFRAANTYYKNRSRIRNGEKIDPLRRVLDNVDYRNSKRNYYKKAEKYNDAYNAYKREYKKVAKPYIDRCKKVALKDLGFGKDSERGKNLMDKHNMWKKYFTMPNYRDIYSFD